MSPATATVTLCLVSHTNVGKTTLARTLLGRDIGEVRDEAHVTSQSESHLLVAAASGEQLMLCDTPGFGDSVRLAKRLSQAGQPIGWFMSEVWDRFRDRAFWSSQRAVRSVLDAADVVLYLVNASETPAAAAHVDAEMKVLQLICKPVIVLLNQLGRPRPAAEEAAEVEQWRGHLTRWSVVHATLALDAFARCWVQEATLLDAVALALPPPRREVFAPLREAWQARQREVMGQAMRLLAERLVTTALDVEPVAEAGWSARLKEVGAALGLRRDAGSPRELAMQSLAGRAEAALRETTDALIRLHGLDGRATAVVLRRLADHYAAREPLDERKAALIGGMATGAAAGLKADIATGGLTLGGGLIAGALIGALGAAGLARGYNLVRGVSTPTLSWSELALTGLLRSALLAYLAVIHHGRGRGPWADEEPAPFWNERVDAVIGHQQATWQGLWSRIDDARGDAGEKAALLDDVTLALDDAVRELLDALYPVRD